MKFFTKEDVEALSSSAHAIAAEYSKIDPGILVRHPQDFRGAVIMHLAIECAIADLKPRRSGAGVKPA
jgi:hypothetical protein